jgi:hypothetical protein
VSGAWSHSAECPQGEETRTRAALVRSGCDQHG